MTKKTSKTRRAEFLNLLEEKAIDIATKVLKGESDSVKSSVSKTATDMTASVVKKSFIGMAIEKGRVARTKVIYRVLLVVAALFIILGGLKVLLYELGYGQYFFLVLGVVFLIGAFIFNAYNKRQ